MMAIPTGKLSNRGDLLLEAAAIAENHELLMIFAMSVIVLVALVFIWLRSNGKSSKSVEPPRPLMIPKEPEQEVDYGKKKVTIFFGTQTGTAEGFAKALAEEAKA